MTEADMMKIIGLMIWMIFLTENKSYIQIFFISWKNENDIDYGLR
jgi:hypothetical protein